MPSSSSEEDTLKKRAPRKRSTRRAVTKKTASKKAPRKRAPRKKVDAPAPEVETARMTEEERPLRKSPTPIAARRAGSKAKKKQGIIIGVILLLGIGSSVAIGITDEGTIDVNQVIEARNERLRSGQTNASDDKQVIVPVQNTAANQLPDGGLVGLGIDPEPPKPAPTTTTASSTASSTEATATSTDEVAEDETEREENNTTTTSATE